MAVRYFSVTCKHGHRGAKKYDPITFAIIAQNAIEASDLAKQMPGVKHDQPVLACKEISSSDYFEMLKHSAYERGWFR